MSKISARTRRLWVMFRLTPDEVAKIESFQRNHTVYRVLLGNRNAVEHDHKTGLIRGRMDWLINRAYGMLEKAAPNNLSEVLLALAVYHERPPASLALGGDHYGLIGQAKYKRRMIYGGPTGEVQCTRRKKRARPARRKKSGGRSQRSSRKSTGTA